MQQAPTLTAGIVVAVDSRRFRGCCRPASTSVVGTKAAYADEEPAGVLYNRGLAYLNAGKFTDAINSFNEVDRQHPYLGIGAEGARHVGLCELPQG